MKVTFRALRGIGGALIAGLRRHGGANPGALRRLRPVVDWQHGADGAPRTLDANETITVTRVGVFAHSDPVRVNDNWRDAPIMLARTMWCSIVALAAAMGWFWGFGPLRDVQAYRRDRDGDRAVG